MIEFCERENVRWFDARSIRSNVEFDRIVSDGVDLLLVGAFGQILDKRILNVARYGVLNFHPSLLPAYKGGSPIEEQILSGNLSGGVTLHWMTEEVDEGPIVKQEHVEIGLDDDYETVLENCVRKGETIVDELLKQPPDEWPKQDHIQAEQGILSPRNQKDGLIDWTDNAMTIYRKVLAFGWKDWARFIAQDGQLIVRKTKIVNGNISSAPGEILSVEPAVVVGCQDCALELLDYSFSRPLIKGEVLLSAKGSDND